MKHFNIHSSVKWGVRAFYGLLILILLVYVSLGIFIKSSLAKELLIKKLSSLTGHPVHIRLVSLDWLHGLHVVLRDVEIPAKGGKAPPWLACRNLLATIKILPFLAHREIVFQQLSLQDGMVRLLRTREGVWKGVIPIPLSLPPMEQRIEKPKKRSIRITLHFPKVTLKRVSADLSFEKKNGIEHLIIFLNKGEMEHHKGGISLEMGGYIRLSRSSNRSNFYVRAKYALARSFPIELSARFSNLSLSDLAGFSDKRRISEIGGASQFSLFAKGSLRESVAFHGKVTITNPRWESHRFRIGAPSGEVSSQYNGELKMPKKAPNKGLIKVYLSPFQLLLLGKHRSNKREIPYKKRLSVKGLSFDGSYDTVQKQIHLSLAGRYGLNGKETAETPAKFFIRSDFSLIKERGLDAAFTFTNVPLEEAFGPQWRQEAVPGLYKETGITSRNSPLSVIDRIDGKLQGNLFNGVISIASMHIIFSWADSSLSISASPFTIAGGKPIHLEVKSKKIRATLAKDTPIIIQRIPTKFKGWCKAIRDGAFSLEGVRLDIERTKSGAFKAVKILNGSLKVSGLSIILPKSGILIGGLQAKASYNAPTLILKDVRFNADNVCRIRIDSLETSDLLSKPLRLKCAGQIDMAGLKFSREKGAPPIAAFVAPRMPKNLPFIPGYLEGKFGFFFEGTLAPFTYENYRITLDGVRLRGKMKEPLLLSNSPFTLLTSAVVQPGEMEIKRLSIVSPLGLLISKGSVKRDQSGKVALSLSCKGKLSIKEGDLQKLASHAINIQLSGLAPFFLKAQGIWPRLFIEGHVGGTGLSFGFRDIFKKEKGMESAVDFQINQSGSHSFKINWIRAAAGQFVVKIWGKINSLFPLRGRVMFETNNHRISSLLPMFPRFFSDPESLKARGEITCLGDVALQEHPLYNIKADLRDVSVPFYKTGEPIHIDKACFVFGNSERSIDIRNVGYKKSMGRRIRIFGSFRKGQWFWTPEVNLGYLNLDDFIEIFSHKKRPAGKRNKGTDPFALAIRLLHGRHMEGSISIARLKVINLQIKDFFMRFWQRGNLGEIKGLNFLVSKGYGEVNVYWEEVGKGIIRLKVLPHVKNLNFGKILAGLLHRDPPFTGNLSFHGRLVSIGGTYKEIKKNLGGHLFARFDNGTIKRWTVLSNIFRLLNVYEILELKFPDIKEGLAYRKIEGSIVVKNGVANTYDAHLESRPFYMAGEGNLRLDNGMLSLLVGTYPFKLVDTFISKIPIIGRVFTNKDKRLIGYFFEIKGPVEDPTVRSVNAKKLGERVWETFKKIITLPLYPFKNHSKGVDEK